MASITPRVESSTLYPVYFPERIDLFMMEGPVDIKISQLKKMIANNLNAGTGEGKRDIRAKDLILISGRGKVLADDSSWKNPASIRGELIPNLDHVHVSLDYADFALDILRQSELTCEFRPKNLPSYMDLTLEMVKQMEDIKKDLPATLGASGAAPNPAPAARPHIRYIPQDLPIDRDFVSEIMILNELAFEFVSKDLPNYRDLTSELLRQTLIQSELFLEFLSKDLAGHKDLLLKTVKQLTDIKKNLPPTLAASAAAPNASRPL